MDEEPRTTTRLLNRFGGGDRGVEGELLDAIYGELRMLAGHALGGQVPGHTLQPTALIHEAWLRLVRQDELEFDGRAQFYGLAGKIMRSILVDHARTANREKRGGSNKRLTLEAAEHQAQSTSRTRTIEILSLEEALQKLEQLDPALAQLVEMRFYAGLTHAEIASNLGVSERTVERKWRAARAFLSSEIPE